MPERFVRIGEGMVTPVGRVAAEELKQRSGEWCIVDGSAGHMLMRRPNEPTLRLAGEIETRGAMFDVLALMGQSGWSGTLIVRSGGATRIVVLEKGRVIDATSDARGEKIVDVILTRGVASRDTVDLIARTAVVSGGSFVDALEQSGAVVAADFAEALDQSARLVVYGVLAAETGAFSFFSRLSPARLRESISLMELLMESAQRFDELGELASCIESEHHIPEPLETRAVPSELVTLYSLCDGRRSVAEVGRRAGWLDYETRKGIAELVRSGLVRMAPPRPRGARAIVEIYSGALFEIHQRCDASYVGQDLRAGLSRFVAGSPSLAALLDSAWPLADGTVVAERVARNLAARPGEAPIAQLIRRLDELVSFALFLTTSLLDRDVATALNVRVAERLALLERASDSMVPPSNRESTSPTSPELVAPAAAPTPTAYLRSGTYPAVKITRSG